MLLEIRELDVSYGAVTALRDVSIDIAEGSIVAILGANGAGKSTLLNTILRISDSRTSGSIRFRGRDTSTWSTERLISEGIALVPEGRQLFSELSVVENLQMGAYLRRDSAKINTDLDRVFTMFPVLRERRHQIAATLSGGEQQMVAIGRAMMSNPRLLLLDEPSLGLAPMLVIEILSMVKEINSGGVTIVLVEQNARQALKIATDGYILEKGSVALNGPAEMLAKNINVTAAYLGSETTEERVER